MLAARRVIADEDRDALLAGLDVVEGELRDGSFAFAPDDEDIHMAIERRLMERWRGQGKSDEDARAWIASNDMPNIERVLARRREADLVIG